tara:strand:- start:27295 stop:28461 length:1167 start_codon:yes stop_codon:yes gene_type:complete
MSDKTPDVDKIKKIVLVGNGFDLAHGYKLRFRDFIYHLLNKIIDDVLYNQYYQSPFLTLQSHNSLDNIDAYDKFKEEPLKRLAEVNKDQLLSVFDKGDLFKALSEQINVENWIDLEDIYFKQLYQIVSSNLSEKGIKASIKELNSEMEYLRAELQEYIKSEMHEITRGSGNDVYRQLTDYINKNDGFISDNIPDSIRPENYMFINFNYTYLLRQYYESMSYEWVEKSSFYNIHGVLDGDDKENGQKMIFGYGDEKNKSYIEFEERKAPKEAYQLIKSYKYLEARTYQKITRELKEKPFQVILMGHSCGDSDRTFLRTLFNHENCRSIKIYYYKNPETGTDDYFDKSLAISMCFDDKEKFRERVLNKKDCEPMSQVLDFAAKNQKTPIT